MTRKINITTKDGKILFSHEEENNTLNNTLGVAIKNKIDLRGMYICYADFTGLDLSGIDLRNSELIYVKFNRANLSNADLSYAKLISANLNRAVLDGTQLFRANLSKADLSYAYLNDSDFSEANLSFAKLHSSELKKAKFIKANLSNADLRYACLNNSDFREANLSNAKLNSSELKDARFINTNLEKADFQNAEATGACLYNANTEGANLNFSSRFIVNDKRILKAKELVNIAKETNSFVQSIIDSIKTTLDVERAIKTLNQYIQQYEEEINQCYRDKREFGYWYSKDSLKDDLSDFNNKILECREMEKVIYQAFLKAL